MKIKIKIASLFAVAAFAGAAHAQTANENNGVPSRDIPNLGPLFRAPIAPLLPNGKSLFGPEMPPIPRLNAASPAGATIRVLQTERGEVFQLEAVRQNRADMLRKITNLMGVRAVIDPQLEKKILITQTFRGLSWDDLLASVNYQVEMVKSPSGTYFFANNPGYTGLITSDQLAQQNEQYRLQQEELRNDPRYDPFVYPRGGLNPKDRFGRPVEPQPHWEKRDFNGREFYYIPGPKN